jgi:hypothetical protein
MESEKEVLGILREMLSKIEVIETLLKKLSFTSNDGCEIEKSFVLISRTLKLDLRFFITTGFLRLVITGW